MLGGERSTKLFCRNLKTQKGHAYGSGACQTHSNKLVTNCSTLFLSESFLPRLRRQCLHATIGEDESAAGSVTNAIGTGIGEAAEAGEEAIMEGVEGGVGRGVRQGEVGREIEIGEVRLLNVFLFLL